MTTLSDVIAGLDEMSEDDVICARKPWESGSECLITRLDDELRVPEKVKAAGYEYFLDVPVAREALGVFGDRTPSHEEKVRLLIHYAVNDAYPEWAYPEE